MSASVAEGVLLCEDELFVPVDVLVRSDALLDRRSDELMSVTELAIECRLPCLRFCGVAGSLGVSSDWPPSRGASSVGGRLSAGGVVAGVRDCDSDEDACLCPLAKKDGRREKKPASLLKAWLWLCVWSAISHTNPALYRLSQGSGD